MRNGVDAGQAWEVKDVDLRDVIMVVGIRKDWK